MLFPRRSSPFRAALALLLVAAGSAHGQGSLTPPGAPGPTMKSMDQVEARTPIPGGSAPYVITAPGSYYLTGNITVGSGDIITVSAPNVTVDLNGFNLSTTSGTPSGTAIKISARRVTVCNGTIFGSGTVSGSAYNGGGFVNGVLWSGPVPQAVVVRDVLVSGCSAIGIKASIVERCVVQNAGTTGISGAIVRSCQADTCAGVAIYAQIGTDCLGSGWTGGVSGGNLANCAGSAAGDDGVGLASTNAQNCQGSGYGNRGLGLNVTTAIGCQGSSDSNVGLQAVAAVACRGNSNTSVGLKADVGGLCRGDADTGIGLVGTSVLIACKATNNVFTLRSLDGDIVIGCTFGAGPISAPYQYNMP